MAEWVVLATAVCSAIATAFAAFATWFSPIRAAKNADQLRRVSERETQARLRKYELFAALMQERAEIYSELGVRSLNLIDVVFSEVGNVRDLWAELFKAFEPSLPTFIVNERLARLLAAIAADIGLSDQFRADDLSRIYFPRIRAEERKVRDLERQEALTRLQRNSPAANAGSGTSVFPPDPA